MGNYYNNNGKYQTWVDKINKTMPTMCYTDNKYMNIFIAFSNIYYDICNNGADIDIDDDRVKVVEELTGIGKFDIFRCCLYFDYLEEKANEIFEKLMDKDLSFENHGFWNEWEERKISMNKQNGENWIYISCGTKANVKKEFENRKLFGFTVV